MREKYMSVLGFKQKQETVKNYSLNSATDLGISWQCFKILIQLSASQSIMKYPCQQHGCSIAALCTIHRLFTSEEKKISFTKSCYTRILCDRYCNAIDLSENKYQEYFSKIQTSYAKILKAP